MSDASIAYQRYLESPHWANVKQRAREDFSGCIVSADTHFELHHLNYRNLGAERWWFDLIPLAPDLHREFHQYQREHELDFYDVLSWLRLSGREITAHFRERLIESHAYNRDLKLGVIKPNVGSRNIFDEPVPPAENPPPKPPKQRQKQKPQKQAPRRRRRRNTWPAQPRDKPVKYLTQLTNQQRAELLKKPKDLRHHRKKWRDASWVKLPKQP